MSMSVSSLPSSRNVALMLIEGSARGKYQIAARAFVIIAPKSTSWRKLSSTERAVG